MNLSKEIGAFFDLDGTLLLAPSLEWRFIGYLLARDEIRGVQAARWLAHLAKTFFWDPHGAIEANKYYLAGLRESLVEEWEKSLAPDSLPIFARGVARIAWHIAQRHRVFLVSGTPAQLARVMARRLSGRVEICATELEVRDGHWTGRIVGEHLSGKAKARAVSSLAPQHGFDLDRSFAYGDCIADLPMLEAVGHPVAVNPSARLERVARIHGWLISRWSALQTPQQNAYAQLFAPKEAR